MSKINFHARHNARYKAVQALYQWQLTGNSIVKINQQFLAEMKPKKVDMEYFSDLLLKTVDELDRIDEVFTPFLVDRTIQELNPIELAVIRLATFELQHCPEVPYRVVVNEAIELTKTFGAQDGYKYVNGVLDKCAVKCRPLETNHSQ